MIIKEDTYFTFLRNRLIVYHQEADDVTKETSLSYVDYPGIRQTMQELVKALVRQNSEALFDDVCTGCGNCCINRPVLLSAKEIRDISRFLSIGDEERFREKYTDPVVTWNRADALLRREGGKCIFLSRGSTRSYRCSIHPARPLVCAAIRPSLDTCEKDPGKLAFHIARMYLSSDQLSVETESGKLVEIPSDYEKIYSLVHALKSQISALEKPTWDSDDQIINEAYRRLEELRIDVVEKGLTPHFFNTVMEVTGLTGNLDTNNPRTERNIEILTEKVRRLQELIKIEEPADSGSETGEMTLERLSFHPESVHVSYKSSYEDKVVRSFQYSGHQELLQKVRTLLERLTCYGDPSVWEALWHLEPQCFLCGECCRCLKVEITPYDIERIALHFDISEVEVWEKYLYPGIFSWNDEDGILAKKDGTRLDLCSSSSPCVFLEGKSDSVALCGIYEFRPDVCKYYLPKNKPCVEMSVLKEKKSFLENIIFIEAMNGALRIHTMQSVAMSRPPLVLYLREDPFMKELHAEIETLILALLDGEALPR